MLILEIGLYLSFLVLVDIDGLECKAESWANAHLRDADHFLEATRSSLLEALKSFQSSVHFQALSRHVSEIVLFPQRIAPSPY